MEITLNNPTYKTADQKRKAQQDTLKLVHWLQVSAPCHETVGQLRAMLADPSLCIDKDAALSLSQQGSFGLLFATPHLAFREALLDAGAAVEGIAGTGYPPLYYALRDTDYDYAKLLLERGANPNRRVSEDSIHTFSAIASKGHDENVPALFQLIADYGFNPNLLLEDENSSWRWNNLSTRSIMQSAIDLGANLMRYNAKGSLIETPITHNSPTLSEMLKEVRPDAIRYRDFFRAAIKPVLNGTMASADCAALQSLGKAELMRLSNTNVLAEVFNPAIWRGNEQTAIMLAETHLHPYQRQMIAEQLRDLYLITTEPATGPTKSWCERIQGTEPTQLASWSRL